MPKFPNRKPLTRAITIMAVILSFPLGWALSSIICPPRYECIVCGRAQWMKGMQVSDKQEFICYEGRFREPGCFKKLWDRAVKELGYKKDGYEKRDKFVVEKIREYLRRTR